MSTLGRKVTIVPDQLIRVIAPYSEVCMHMNIAGRPMLVQLIKRVYPEWTGYSAQFYSLDGSMFSSPVTYGEAGIYREGDAFYTYENEGTGDLDPQEVMRELKKTLNEALSGFNVKVITN